jgi:hypothetical protein
MRRSRQLLRLLVLLAVLAFALAAPAVSFPPMCSCDLCREHPDWACSFPPGFWDCEGWYHTFCPVAE